MRCVECETEPLTPGHFCECCGRKLSVAERTTVEANPVPAAPVVEASPRAAFADPARVVADHRATDPFANRVSRHSSW